MTSPAAASPSIFPPAWPLPTADHPFPSHLLWPKGSEGFSVLLGSDPDTLDIKEVAGGGEGPTCPHNISSKGRHSEAPAREELHSSLIVL